MHYKELTHRLCNPCFRGHFTWQLRPKNHLYLPDLSLNLILGILKAFCFLWLWIAFNLEGSLCTLHSPIDSRWTPHIPHNSMNSRWSPCGVRWPALVECHPMVLLSVPCVHYLTMKLRSPFHMDSPQKLLVLCDWIMSKITWCSAILESEGLID